MINGIYARPKKQRGTDKKGGRKDTAIFREGSKSGSRAGHVASVLFETQGKEGAL